MVFAKGPIPGETPKADALDVHPGAVCKRVSVGYANGVSITGYVIYLSNGKAIASAGSAPAAWRNALSQPTLEDENQ